MGKKRRGDHVQSFSEALDRLKAEGPAVKQYFSPVRNGELIDTQGRRWVLSKSLLSKAAARELLELADMVIIGDAPLGRNRSELDTELNRKRYFDSISSDYYDDEPIDKAAGELVYYGYEFSRPGGRLLYIEQECVP